ncbi:MAG: hypothetical protein IPM54_10405 [Polyangiaceae bacterium]|nr:hypothetical protein [Polyangiaceae bacterium]
MPSKFKKLVRERREKTGESRQTAARHIRNQRRPVGRFEAILLNIIELTKKRQEEYEADPRYRERKSMAEIAQFVDEDLLSPPPAKKALDDALHALPRTDVWKLVAMMYFGVPWEENDVFTIYQGMFKNDGTVMSLGKRRVVQYLENGLARAKRDGIDLEASFDKAA